MSHSGGRGSTRPRPGTHGGAGCGELQPAPESPTMVPAAGTLRRRDAPLSQQDRGEEGEVCAQQDQAGAAIQAAAGQRQGERSGEGTKHQDERRP